MPGRVVGIVDYGVFVDIGGVDGLVHISKLDRLHVEHPRSVLSVGDEVTVRIDELDVERGRISLNRKALQPDPWDNIDEYFQEGDLATGIVANVVTYGVFVALPHGFRGLLHVNEMSSFEISDPHGFVEEGEEILVRIVEIDRERKRINMSLDAVTTEERLAWMVEREEAAQVAAQDEEPGEEVDASAEVPGEVTASAEVAMEVEPESEEELNATAEGSAEAETEGELEEEPGDLEEAQADG
jgi:ribosomal protein S1